MSQIPPPLLLRTFLIGAVLKLVGVLSALLTALVLVNRVTLDQWWMALVSAIVLILLLIPWPWSFLQTSRGANGRLIAALTVGIVSPYVDMIQSLWTPLDELLTNPNFMALAWTLDQVNSVHALGLIFVMLPVVLASWHYGRNGMLISLGAAGLLYVVIPFYLPADSFNWLLYGVRGFVILGMTLILATTTYALADAQRREHQAVVTANRQLAQQAMTMEQLATVRERNRLSRELHDTLAHSLSGTAVQLQAVSTLLKYDQEQAATELNVARDQIKLGLEEARRAIASLRATPLEDLGLREAIVERAQTISRRSGIDIHCELAEIPSLPALTEQTVYRIMDEAVLNAEKHAQAEQILVSLAQQGEHIMLTVRDNGCGFMERGEGPAGHLGLTSMRERARLVGGDLRIQSEPGAGTCVTAQLPAPLNRTTEATL